MRSKKLPVEFNKNQCGKGGMLEALFALECGVVKITPEPTDSTLRKQRSEVTSTIPPPTTGFKVYRVRRTWTNSGIAVPAAFKQK
ncbi:hypothetical protein TNCV_4124881 [Trichonephila clavipes]|nr:hypothetical protein TNCV_4124881 [Trichonephila clavipes]